MQVYADANMLDFTLRNLLSNAIKFTHRGGSIAVKAEANKELVLITVTDNGIGIEEETIKKLFTGNLQHSTPGTAKEKGTGFGLLLCKDFVGRNGGKILLESKAGIGCLFYCSC